MAGNKSLTQAPVDPSNQSQLSNQGLNNSFVNQVNTGVAGATNAGPQTYNANPYNPTNFKTPVMSGGSTPSQSDLFSSFQKRNEQFSGGVNSMISAIGEQRRNPGGTAMLDAARTAPIQMSGRGKGGQGVPVSNRFRY